MMESALAYDRPRLLDALRRIGGDDEESVLDAARAAAAIIATARVDWDDLLAPALPVPDAAPEAEPADDGARIATLLARSDISTEARESLEEMARDRAAGTMRDEDRTYLHALYQRLVTAGRAE